ncbi:SNF1-related protein kinase regulatory subunit gamma-1-like [Salvia hispanica]|uniref:SNF1-related protein kinase regulatory subunit gamma-1-like n=1 Tax=Salvia hispanica TaxID=49212 RepID=UPI0020092E15|nr:SNF1-related protein kinase regulatory subunit gamma-1-like [Salvia hispanica]XP_047959427.1 SNF1-related protein kinase regulatory subunit gamma-1-like [Salvia hispanica]XP_047959428.1 SNF1-related protein kinase regulatory subunit gamma-1-like [Salvia hispanica]
MAAKAKQESKSGKEESFDAYFDMVQSRKKLPCALQEKLTSAFAKIPASSFPKVPGGKVIEIQADMSIGDALKVLSETNILSAPVVDPEARDSKDWRNRYLGIVDYSAIVLYVMQTAEIAAVTLSATSAAAAGVGTAAAGTIGALALGATGPLAVAGLTVAAVGAAVAGGVAADRGMGKDAATAADKLGNDFYKVILHEEPFKSTTVRSILKSYRWVPFVPVAPDSSMLSVMLLLSKYRLRNVPVIELGSPSISNFITQSAVVHGLQECRGRDWFDCIAAHPISDLGLPFMSPDQVVSVRDNELVLEAFKKMKENQIGGLPVVEGESTKIFGNISIRDIRFLLLKPELFTNFRELTVKDFIKAVASTTDDNGKIVTPITCQSSSTLGTVIDTLASRAVHRIYVVSGEGKQVLGVVTLRDVISCFITEPPNFFDDYFGFTAKEILSR